MYLYSPPKSNMWGHSLRKMEPARQKALFVEFLKNVVAEYSFTNGSLTLFPGPTPSILADHLKDSGPWGHVTSDDVKRFEHILGAVARNNWFYSLTPQQCEMALDEVIRNSALIPGVMLLQSVDISKWLIDGQPVAIQSQIMLYYGMKPCISTFLQFQTTDQFQFIKRALSDLDFCELNEKHLKPIKRGLKKKNGEITDERAA
jgi:hypothetical protein